MSSLQYSGSSAYYKKLAELPTPTFTNFLVSNSGCTAIRVGYSIRDHERNTRCSVRKMFTLSKSALGSELISSSTVTQDSPAIHAITTSPSGKRQAILREVTDQNGGKKRFVEVWIDSQLEASLEVTKRHGPFDTDDFFRSLSFTPSETALIYPKFRFIPHFGERLHFRKRPILYVFRWRSISKDTSPSNTKVAKRDVSLTALSLEQSPAIPVIFGQATETRLFATGYEQTADGRLLGIGGCLNRPCSIWELTFEGEAKEAVTPAKSVVIETPDLSCRSPRILYDKDGIASKLFWLHKSTRWTTRIYCLALLS